MDPTAYEYRGLMAEAWDVLRGDSSGWPDRAFFLEVVNRSGQPVLDVGCGTGRLLLDYPSMGIDIDGVDNSPEMLPLLLRKAAGQGMAVSVPLATRSYTQDQARALFEAAGFQDVQLHHEFTFEPAHPDDRLFTVVARLSS